MQTETIITLFVACAAIVCLYYFHFLTAKAAHDAGYEAGMSEAAEAHAEHMLAQKQATYSAWKRIDAMNEELERASIASSRQLAAAHEKLESANAVIDHLKSDKGQLVAVTPQEIGVLIQAANLIELAHRTWAPIKGVEPTARKAQTVLQKLEALNTRLAATAQAAQGQAA